MYLLSFVAATITLMTSVICVGLYTVHTPDGMMNETRLLGAFFTADTDGNGVLDTHELIVAIQKVGATCPVSHHESSSASIHRRTSAHAARS